jgi:photosystem II stability/assembly factor-like uncharacterized protein
MSATGTRSASSWALAISLGAMALLVFLLVPARAAAVTTPGWTRVRSPWGPTWSVNDVYAFGTTRLAAAGDGGRIGLSRDGGRTWGVTVPPGHGAWTFTAIAFGTDGRGVVASGGKILVTTDAGKTWQDASYVGPGPGQPVEDIARRGSRIVAVGDVGLIMSSSDAGATWHNVASPTTADLTCVVIAGDGSAVAGSAAGEVLVAAADVWTVAAVAGGPVTSVAASASPVWGDGRPDLFAATGADVLGSDDAVGFSSLPGLPDLTAHAWPLLTWTGAPQEDVLIAGVSEAGCFDPGGPAWAASSTGLSQPTRAVAPGRQSVAYLLAGDGTLLRTLSAGQQPATLSLSRTSIVTGGRTRLTAQVAIGAPGELRLERRVPGGAWQTAKLLPWTAADLGRTLAFDFNPALTQQYRLAFAYGGKPVDLPPVAQVDVRPTITTSRSLISLRAGAVYRFAGSVSPRLPGEKVELQTDRGGGWRPVSLQATVKLASGRTWSSRSFGTPKAETYHLRAHLAATRVHAEAWSRVVTVSISR